MKKTINQPELVMRIAIKILVFMVGMSLIMFLLIFSLTT